MSDPVVGAAAEPLPKPSRFQFVPVPGEFTRGRWKCRDSYHPYAETLEFEKKTSKEEANPDNSRISVSFKLRQSKEEEEAAGGDVASSSTIQVTSVKSTNGEMAEEANSSLDNIVITRKNGVTIVRKTSTAAPPSADCDQIRELSIDDFETKQEKAQQVPPTPMNTPPATLQEPLGETLHAPTMAGKPKIFQVQSVLDATPTRKFSDSTVIQQHQEQLDDSAYSATVPAQKGRLFQVEPVVDPQFSQPEVHLKDEPTFQVIQTEESKNMSMDSVKNVIDGSSSIETPTKTVQITVSAAGSVEKKDTTTGSLEGCGIPIPPTAPHSTPYGTPKDTQKFPTFDDALQQQHQEDPEEVANESSTISVLSQEKPNNATPEKLSLLPPVSVNVESSLPIDNKIEQAMELVKTHLTYAVREEVDTLRNTIADLEYQMREFQFECSYFRQNCPPETVEAAAAFVRQQMQKLQPPTRRAVSTTCAPSMEGIQHATGGHGSSTHMRNLQTQIQQIKQIIPVAVVPKPSPTNSSTPSTTSGNPSEIDASLHNIHVNNIN